MSSIYTSTHYNLKQICPKLLMYKNSYIRYYTDLYVFRDNPDTLKELTKTPIYNDLRGNLVAVSNYLAYTVLTSMLVESFVVQKDMEEYYNSNMLSMLRKLGLLKDIPLSVLGSCWRSIQRAMVFLQEKVKEYERFYPMYEVLYNDSEHNYRDKVPIVGVNPDKTLSLVYLMQTKDADKGVNGNHLDIIRVPSICKVLLFFKEKHITVRQVDIIWMPLGERFRAARFMSAKYPVDEGLMTYVETKYKRDNKIITDPYKCHACPFWESCRVSNKFLDIKTSVALI